MQYTQILEAGNCNIRLAQNLFGYIDKTPLHAKQGPIMSPLFPKTRLKLWKEMKAPTAP